LIDLRAYFWMASKKYVDISDRGFQSPYHRRAIIVRRAANEVTFDSFQRTIQIFGERAIWSPNEGKL
jgi:hypothetical protein